VSSVDALLLRCRSKMSDSTNCCNRLIRNSKWATPPIVATDLFVIQPHEVCTPTKPACRTRQQAKLSPKSHTCYLPYHSHNAVLLTWFLVLFDGNLSTHTAKGRYSLDSCKSKGKQDRPSVPNKHKSVMRTYFDIWRPRRMLLTWFNDCWSNNESW
jgi:hypothetical protein